MKLIAAIKQISSLYIKYRLNHVRMTRHKGLLNNPVKTDRIQGIPKPLQKLLPPLMKTLMEHTACIHACAHTRTRARTRADTHTDTHTRTHFKLGARHLSYCHWRVLLIVPWPLKSDRNALGTPGGDLRFWQ